MFFRCPSIQAHCNEAVIYLNFGTPKNNEFSIWNKWKIYYFKVSQYLSTLGYSIFLHDIHLLGHIFVGEIDQGCRQSKSFVRVFNMLSGEATLTFSFLAPFKAFQ